MVKRTYVNEGSGMDYPSERATVRTYPNGVTRTVAYDYEHKVVIWDYTNDMHAEQ